MRAKAFDHSTERGGRFKATRSCTDGHLGRLGFGNTGTKRCRKVCNYECREKGQVGARNARNHGAVSVSSLGNSMVSCHGTRRTRIFPRSTPAERCN